MNYGMGPKKLSRDLGCTLVEAKAKIAIYKNRYPAVDKFMEEAIKEGRKYGFAFTIMGRRRSIPMISSSSNQDRALGERLAVNTPIQGSAADVTRAAQMCIDEYDLAFRYDCHMLLQVHDELVFECPEETAEEASKDIEILMAHPFFTDLPAPMVAVAAIGNTWNEAK